MSLTRDQVLQYVEDLYKFRDLYIEEHSVSHASQKAHDVERQMNETLEVVEKEQSVLKNKAEYYMLKGKCLNVLPDYDAGAEDSLSKAVKLDPKHVEAWNILGECFWKKGDIESARNCFTGALQHSVNKVSLRNLSMVLRQFGNTREEKLKNINDSVTKAKEAIQLDVKDGTSWFILGNAYLAQFFGGTQNEEIIKQCMRAYSLADNDPVTKSNPDLHFNRSMCLLYQSNFNDAFQGFSRAALLDPGCETPIAKVEMLKKYLQTSQNMALTKCSLDGKSKLQKIVSGISESQLGPFEGGSYTSSLGKTIILKKQLISDLTLGINSETVVHGKVIGSVTADPAVPYTFFLIDQQASCVAVCIYNLSTTYGLKTGDSVAIPEPYLMTVEVDSDSIEKGINYRMIRIESPLTLVVNGKKLGLDKQAPAVLKLTAQSE